MPSPMTRSGQKKLSDLARHICKPQGIVSTGFPAVRDRALDMGVPFDPWQDGIGRLALAKRESGLYAAGIGGVVLSVPRQTGKTYLVAGMVFALCTLNPNLTVIWTAHRTRTHNETFGKMRGMAQRSKIKPYIEWVRATNGEQEIRFNNGSRIMFGARESGFGRGFDEVDVLVLDEAQILSEDAMSDMVPATNAAKNGLVFLMGTPPRPRDPGEVFSNIRNAALAGDPDTLYVEFSADRDASLDDRKQLSKANPSYPERTSEAAIQRMKKLLGSDDSFSREAYGIWDEEAVGVSAVDVKRWHNLGVSAETAPTEGRVVYGVKFSADGGEVALGVAVRPERGPVHVAPVRHANMGDGTEWLVEWLVERAKGAAQIVIDGKSGSEALVTALRSAGVRHANLIIKPTVPQVAAAHSMFRQAVTEGSLSHPHDAGLDAQVSSAVRRVISKVNGGLGWQAPEGGTVTLFEAVTFAFWGAATTKRNPGVVGSDRPGRRVSGRSVSGRSVRR